MKALWFVQNIAVSIADFAGAVSRRRMRRLLILLPVLLAIALALALVSSSGALAPFLYPLF